VLEGSYISSGQIFAGVPAKIIKTIKEEDIHGLTKKIANNYIMYSNWYKED
jgi:carbonic anhydrase/acetyltransferase-like protein (isoleucine patch superfamily)